MKSERDIVRLRASPHRREVRSQVAGDAEQHVIAGGPAAKAPHCLTPAS